MRTERNYRSHIPAVALGATALTAAFLARRYHYHIEYYLRLAHASHVGKQFYQAYPQLDKDIGYAPERTLDVYRPGGLDDCPVIIFIHGGTWSSGTKELYAPVAQKLLPHGVVVVIPSYTLFPQATYRRQVAEVAAALAWTLDSIHDYGGDPQRVFVAGHSAGAHLAALALLDPRWLAPHGRQARDFAGLIGLSGVYDIALQMEYEHANHRTAPIMNAVMEGPPNFAAASPMRYVRADLPPTLLIHGDSDLIVPSSMSAAFHQALGTAGAQSQSVVYPHTNHAGLMFDALTQQPARLVTDFTNFINVVAGQNARLPSESAHRHEQ